MKAVPGKQTDTRRLTHFSAQGLIRRYRRKFPNALLSRHLALDEVPEEEEQAEAAPPASTETPKAEQGN